MDLYRLYHCAALGFCSFYRRQSLSDKSSQYVYRICLAKYSHRIHSAFHLLVVSFFLLLVFYTPFLYQVGFQMSYLAVLGIIKIHPLLQKLWCARYPVLKKILGNHHRVLGRSNCSRPLKCFLFPSISGFVPPFQLAYPSLFWLVFDREYGLGGPYCTKY